MDGKGWIYNLAKLDWAYDGFSRFSECYDKVLKIDEEFQKKDTNGFFKSGGAYDFLLSLERNYTGKHDCLNMCPGIE